MIPTKTKHVLDETKTDIGSRANQPMTDDQADLLLILCEEASEPFDAGLTQAQALARIEALRQSLNADQNL